ncbi:Uncharacterized protein EJ110_NYTH55635 [Nymphaea thermarum]|nr:Uncharacterized protein EJ110_NYTH55635 [Nymphaea thermarum]
MVGCLLRLRLGGRLPFSSFPLPPKRIPPAIAACFFSSSTATCCLGGRFAGLLPRPPAPKKIPFRVAAHGRSWDDPYNWMRNTDDPDFARHLEEENAYSEAFMAGTAGLQRKLVAEMKARMPPEISTPPERYGPWKVLELLHSHHLYAKAFKCVFGSGQVTYLEHTVTGQGVRLENDKVVAVRAWNISCGVNGLHAFLGLAGYYRHFAMNFGVMATSLTRMLKKNKFSWTEQCIQLKEAISSASVLVLPDFNRLFIVELDAVVEPKIFGYGALIYSM